MAFLFLCFDEIGKHWDRIMESIPIKPNAHPSAVRSRKGERQQSINTIVEMRATTRERTNSVYREDYLLWDRFCGGREGQLATQKIEARWVGSSFFVGVDGVSVVPMVVAVFRVVASWHTNEMTNRQPIKLPLSPTSIYVQYCGACRTEESVWRSFSYPHKRYM